MQHLVSSQTVVQGPTAFNAVLRQPPPRTPFFGVETLSPDLLKMWREFYRDEFVLAFPTPPAAATIADIDEKALYTRGSYSSRVPRSLHPAAMGTALSAERGQLCECEPRWLRPQAL